jgi:pyruvate-formate lyase-activating enzyme
MVYEFPKISRARIKAINTESKVIGDGTTEDPTEEEKAWMDIIASSAPELEVKQKKLLVCTNADVEEYDANSVKVKYDGVSYTIKKPANSLQIARARERSVMAALEVLNAQSCICVGAVPLARDFSGVSVEVIRLLASVAEDFFFTPYL